MTDPDSQKDQPPEERLSPQSLRWRVEAEGPPSANAAPSLGGPINEEKRKTWDEKWISAQEARTLIAKAAGSRTEAETLLLEALKGGAFRARGIPSDEEARRYVQTACGLPEDDFQAIMIEPTFWGASTDDDRAKWNWLTGEFASGIETTRESGAYFGIEFPRFEILALLNDHGLIERDNETAQVPPREHAPESDQKPPKNRGGRPTGKHGEPIATIAIRLYLMKEEELEPYTVLAISKDLETEYRKLGIQIPHGDNLEVMSSGIRRAVTKAKASD